MFVPANLQTRSNASVVLKTQIFNGVISPSNTPWWSGIQTVQLQNVPSKAVCLLAEIKYKVSSVNNNSVSLFIRKDATENWISPSESTIGGNITVTQFNNLNQDYRKIVLDPIGSSTTPFEAETYTTVPIYFNTTTNSFHWFIADRKELPVATAPYYLAEFRLIGYYVVG